MIPSNSGWDNFISGQPSMNHMHEDDNWLSLSIFTVSCDTERKITLVTNLNKQAVTSAAISNRRYSWHNTHCRRHFTYLTTLSSSRSDDNATKLLSFLQLLYLFTSALHFTSYLHFFWSPPMPVWLYHTHFYPLPLSQQSTIRSHAAENAQPQVKYRSLQNLGNNKKVKNNNIRKMNRSTGNCSTDNCIPTHLAFLRA